MLSYDKYIEAFKKRLLDLLAIAPSPEKVDELESDEEQREFVLAFREISKLILRLKSFTEFEFNEEKLGIDEQTFEDYKSKYFAIHDNLEKMKSKDKVSVLADIDFSIELLMLEFFIILLPLYMFSIAILPFSLISRVPIPANFLVSCGCSVSIKLLPFHVNQLFLSWSNT